MLGVGLWGFGFRVSTVTAAIQRLWRHSLCKCSDLFAQPPQMVQGTESKGVLGNPHALEGSENIVC